MRVLSGLKSANIAAPTRMPILKESNTLRVTIASNKASNGGSIDQVEVE